jgi:splicing factor 3A subunit 2
MDRQNRVGSKFGGGGVSSSQQSERERKERLKRLALESIDLAKDPYLIRNHVGSYECRLCFTLHRDEANYLSHTQGKKHQSGLTKRALQDKQRLERDSAKNNNSLLASLQSNRANNASSTKAVTIGRPAYQVYKSRDPETNQRCLSFEISYPDIVCDSGTGEALVPPSHRFMSAFEQRIENPALNRQYQYLLFAAQPYDTIAFKVPNEPIDRSNNGERFITYWDHESKKFIVTMYFLNPSS